MPYKLSKKLKAHRLVISLLVFSIAAIPISASTQEKACIINDSGKKVCGKLVRDNDENQSNIPSQSIVTVKYKGLITNNIQLLKCSRKSSMVTCKFYVTMKEAGQDGNSWIKFYGASGTKISQATDNQGEDYIAEKVVLGKSESKEDLYTLLVKDQPISVAILFRIPSEINSIKTLSFLSMDVNSSQNAAVFSNVNISQ